LQLAVVDHLERWAGSRRRPVQLVDVESRLVSLSAEFNGAEVYGDPDQFLGTLQALNRRRVRAKEWPFTTSSVGQVATALVQAFRNRQIVVPDSPGLKDELLRVRLRESSPGVTRLDHDRSGHDDQAVTIGMACHILLANAWNASAAFREFVRRDLDDRDDRDARRARKAVAERFGANRAARAGTARAAAQRQCENHRWRGSPDGRVCLFCGAADGVGKVVSAV
jgi:hypothetical protein